MLSLVCHASKIVLEIIRNLTKPHIAAQMVTKQAGFRIGKGTIEQIFSLRLLTENNLGMQDGVVPRFHRFQKSHRQTLS